MTPWWSFLLADGAHHKKPHSPTHPIQSHYLNQWWLVYRRIYASLGLNELRLWADKVRVFGSGITQSNSCWWPGAIQRCLHTHTTYNYAVCDQNRCLMCHITRGVWHVDHVLLGVRNTTWKHGQNREQSAGEVGEVSEAALMCHIESLISPLFFPTNLFIVTQILYKLGASEWESTINPTSMG